MHTQKNTNKKKSNDTKYYKVVFHTTKCDSVLVVLFQYYSVLQGATKYYSSSTVHYKVLHSTILVLLRTTKYYSVLFCAAKSYPVLQSATRYYSLQYYPYHKVVLQYYWVLQRSIPVLFCTTGSYKICPQYYSVLQSASRYYSSTSLYYKVLLQYYSVRHSYTQHSASEPGIEPGTPRFEGQCPILATNCLG